MRVLVIGAGATGGLFGVRLAQAGRDVTFLVRPKRAEVLRQRGLRVHGAGQDLTIQPKLLVTGEITETYDVILVSVKASGLEQAIEDFAPAVGPDTLIMPFLNGMRHMEALDKQFGADRVLGGVVRVQTTVDDNGDILRVGELEDMSYGARAGTAPARLDEVHKTLSGAGFPAELSEHIDADMWAKWVFIASLGGANGLLRGTVGEIVAAGGARFAADLVDECAAVAAKAGYPLPQAVHEALRARSTAQGSPAATSMYRDLSNGYPTESEHILGDLVDRARQLGVPTPVLELAAVSMRVYENKLAAQ
ncbi:ketopantoate reductase family protein [Kutzneria sp. CA-103260]|uniref:ketopantoate reductase family protein n=1 Tax=Kutzneria sp. CA-103260 TaxID=2802641 RepID=UPI001BA8EF1B|nr:ketopantoate reductase family protein [Kutzneria sp. CA-103260]QUQ62367.1 2-dehydropantoate 2-reductase [Kutzneria sp. CA-103260]